MAFVGLPLRGHRPVRSVGSPGPADRVGRVGFRVSDANANHRPPIRQTNQLQRHSLVSDDQLHASTRAFFREYDLAGESTNRVVDCRLEPFPVGGEADHRGPLDVEGERLALSHRALEVDHQVASALVLEAVADRPGRVTIAPELNAMTPEMVEDGRDTILEEANPLRAMERRSTPLGVVEDQRGVIVEDLVGAADRTVGEQPRAQGLRVEDQAVNLG